MFITPTLGLPRIKAGKIRALGWESGYPFNAALEKTVRWYVENEWWWRKIKTGEYMAYYKQQYGERLK